MKNVCNLAACVFLLAIVFSCKNDKVPEVTQTVTVGDLHLKKSAGADCDKPDTLRMDCLAIDLTWPNVEQGNEVLKKNVSNWANSFLAGLMTPYPEEQPAPTTTVEAAAEAFIKSHEESVKENPGSPSGNWVADSEYNILLNDGKYLTLEIGAFIFIGGAHGTPIAAVATFDAQTGKQLALTDLVADTAAFKALAEKTFRAERTDLFKPTDGSEPFEFNEIFQFTLPQNFGLTEDGIYCHYVAYEVGPYAIGSTQITIPFSALGGGLKVELPKPSPESSEEVSDIYETEGDSVVIPTFEIEVSSSPKVIQTLSKQKETVIVAAYFSGDPANEKDREEDGQMFITDKLIELQGNTRIARFEGVKFSKKTYAKLADKDITLLINIFSGRKSTDDNLLDCGIMELHASKFGNRRFVLGCKLIEENMQGGTSGYPIACYALPTPDDSTNQALPLLVDCSEKGEIEFAGQPMKDYDALISALRGVLKDLVKNGAKELPELKTQGCMMGNSGEIRTRYEELRSELLDKAKTTRTTSEKVDSEESKKSKVNTPKPVKTSLKSAPGLSSSPALTLDRKGVITLNGKKVSLENLRKELQQALLTYAVIPDQLDLKTIGETGMGMRGEVRTVIEESIAGAKWVRKKTAISALNASVGKKLGTVTQLELGIYQTSGPFAYISAKPKLADGKAIDYGKTDYSKDAKSPSFTDNAIGLLQYENGTWKVLAYSIGVNKPPVDVWVKNYKAPKALF